MANKAIVGEKVGMTQVWDEDNRVLPVTVLRVRPNRVVQVKTTERDGYSAVCKKHALHEYRAPYRCVAGCNGARWGAGCADWPAASAGVCGPASCAVMIAVAVNTPSSARTDFSAAMRTVLAESFSAGSSSMVKPIWPSLMTMPDTCPAATRLSGLPGVVTPDRASRMLCSVKSLGMLEILCFRANMWVARGEINRPPPFCNMRWQATEALGCEGASDCPAFMGRDRGAGWKP